MLRGLGETRDPAVVGAVQEKPKKKKKDEKPKKKKRKKTGHDDDSEDISEDLDEIDEDELAALQEDAGQPRTRVRAKGLEHHRPDHALARRLPHCRGRLELFS